MEALSNMSWDRIESYIAFDRLPLLRRSAKAWDGGEFIGLFGIIDITPVTRIIGEPDVDYVTSYDRINKIESGASSVTDYQLSVDWDTGLTETHEVSWSSSNESVATVTDDGFVSWVSDGDVVITATSRDLVLKTPLTMQTSTDAAVTLVDFVEGSLAEYLRDSVLNRIAGITPDESKDMFISFPANSNYDGSVVTGYSGPITEYHEEAQGEDDEWIRNPDCWLDGIDTSSVCVGYEPPDRTGWRRFPTGTMVTPQHFLSCEHSSFYPRAGGRMAFLSATGVLEVRTVLSTKVVSPWKNGGLDIAAGILSEPLVHCAFAKVLPEDFLDYGTGNPLPPHYASSGFHGIPLVVIDQQRHAQIYPCFYIAREVNGKPVKSVVVHWGANEETRIWVPGFMTDALAWIDTAEWNRVWPYSGIELYDSGTPTFVLSGDDLVLLGNRTSTASTNGVYGFYQQLINGVLADLSDTHGQTVYTLTEADFSDWPKYIQA